MASHDKQTYFWVKYKDILYDLSFSQHNFYFESHINSSDKAR